MASLSWITLLAFVLSVAFCLGFRGLAREWYLIDVPDAFAEASPFFCRFPLPRCWRSAFPVMPMP